MTTPCLHLIFATKDGQTLKIAERMAAQWQRQNLPYALHDMAHASPDPTAWPTHTPVVVMAPIRHGHPLPQVEAFLKKHKKTLNNHKLILISINLTSRKPEKNSPQTNAYYKKWVKRHRLKPVFGAVLAGRLEYRLYRTWEKWMIRFIMFLTGGPTDFKAVVDFTPWDQVDALACQIADLAQKKEAA